MTEKPHLWLGFAPRSDVPYPEDWEYQQAPTADYEPTEGDVLHMFRDREYVFRGGNWIAAEKRAEALSPKSSGDRP